MCVCVQVYILHIHIYIYIYYARRTSFELVIRTDGSCWSSLEECHFLFSLVPSLTHSLSLIFCAFSCFRFVYLLYCTIHMSNCQLSWFIFTIFIYFFSILFLFYIFIVTHWNHGPLTIFFLFIYASVYTLLFGKRPSRKHRWLLKKPQRHVNYNIILYI